MRVHSYLIAATLIIGACGPSHRLNSKTTHVRSFASAKECAQGPFELTIPAKGHRWGEALELRVKTPRRVQLIATIDRGVGLAIKRERLLGGRGTKPDNKRCVVSLNEVPNAGTTGSTGTKPPGSRPGTPGSGGNTTTTDRRPPAPVPTLVPVRTSAGGETLLRVSWRNPSLEPPILKAGLQLRVRIWSLVPNDLQGVVFSLRHDIYKPSSGDAAFEAHLRKLMEKRRRRRVARVRKRRQRPAPQPISSATLQRRRVEYERRRLRQERQRRDKIRRARLRREYCASHLKDRECWGPGGFRTHLVMNARAADRAKYCRSNRNDARCWSRTERYRRQLRWRRKTITRRPSKPTGPPPPPRAETQSPRPSTNAQWRPGYWHWAAGWKWLAGQWRVPKTDIDGGLTTRAPRRPPPPRTEQPPPPPVPRAVWIVGYWQWSGSEFVWVPGSWQLAPTVGLRWQPARWRVGISGVTLIPGRWVRVVAP